jgi:hypothetical protein
MTDPSTREAARLDMLRFLGAIVLGRLMIHNSADERPSSMPIAPRGADSRPHVALVRAAK